MDKIERVARIQSGYFAFDGLVKEINSKYFLKYPITDYFTIEENMSKSEGNVSLYFDTGLILPENIKNEIGAIFGRCFPFPIGTGV